MFHDACGSGTVTIEVKKRFPDIPVLAIDSSAGMLEVLNRKIQHHDFKNVTTKHLDAGDLTGMCLHSLTQTTYPTWCPTSANPPSIPSIH